MSKTSRANLIPLTDPSQIPTDMTEEDARTFWETHEITEAYLKKVDSGLDGPPVREKADYAKPTSMRLERNTTVRLKVLAKKKGMAYQTLLKQFVLERLYEEEKREGMLPPREVSKER